MRHETESICLSQPPCCCCRPPHWRRRASSTTTVSLRAGPGEGFPTVDRIPGGDRVNIHGCLKGTAWCDVSWSDDRGWVSSQYLEYLYRDRYVYLPDYVDEIDVPVVPFVLTSYWSSYYADVPGISAALLGRLLAIA